MCFSDDNSAEPLARMMNASRTHTVHPERMTTQLPLAPTAWATCLKGTTEHLCPSGVGVCAKGVAASVPWLNQTHNPANHAETGGWCDDVCSVHANLAQ